MRAGIEALVLDLDGVVIFRPPWQAKAERDYRKIGSGLYLPPKDIPQIARDIRHEKLGAIEAAAFAFNTLRCVFPDVTRVLPQIKGVDIYGNTGRSNKEAWTTMTRWQLRMGGIEGCFQDIFFKPKGATTIGSKLGNVAYLLEKYGVVRCVDDNPADLLPILNKFPDRVEGVLVRDRSTDLLLAGIDIKSYPNFRVVSKFRDAIGDLLPQPHAA